MMLGNLVKSLADLTLSNPVCTSRSVLQRSLCTTQTREPLLSHVAKTKTSLLLPSTTVSATNHRTYFSLVDDWGRGEGAKDGYGITLFDREGKRTSLKAVELRFKRLDWGAWIRPRAGRNKKIWKKSTMQLRAGEKHVFCVAYHKRRFDRAVLQNIKEVRYIPDDPYKVYNDMSYQNHHSLKHKNAERIKKYGSQIYNFPFYRAHYKHIIIASDKKDNYGYEPPSYHKDIVDGDGIYSPDRERATDIPAPNYVLEERGRSKCTKQAEKKYWKQLKRGEKYYGHLSQSHPLKLPAYGTFLG